MKLTTKLADSIMNDLACLAVSALGGYPKEGLSDYDMFFVKTYAQETFLKLCKEFEDQMGIKWEAVENS
jgi:hypothetical protein